MVAGDFPAVRWAPVLVGPWWPAASTALRAAAQHWAAWATRKEELAQSLHSQREILYCKPAFSPIRCGTVETWRISDRL